MTEGARSPGFRPLPAELRASVVPSLAAATSVPPSVGPKREIVECGVSGPSWVSVAWTRLTELAEAAILNRRPGFGEGPSGPDR